jgi:hypothetical protein
MSAYYYNEDFLKEYVGCGMSTSNVFDRASLGTTVETGIEKIQDSIYTILSTRIGERLFLPEFGSKLHTLVFEQNNSIFADLADFYIRDALSKWEHRIDVIKIDVKIETDENIVPIEIYYKIVNSNLVSTYVYPFNKNSYGEPEIYEQGTISANYY